MIGIGHRVVHGGMKYTAPTRLDRVVLASLSELIPLAPLHQPHNLAPIRTTWMWRLTFHKSLLRYGVSSQSAARRAILCPAPASHRRGRPALWLPRTVLRISRRAAAHRVARACVPAGDHCASGQWREFVCCQCRPQRCQHHGIYRGRWPDDGDSLWGSRPGRAVISHAGIPDGCGCHRGFDVPEVGLAGCLLHFVRYAHTPRLIRSTGTRSDCTFRLSDCPREVGSLTATLGGIDGIVFSGGIEENDAATRAEVVDGCGWTGAILDAGRNTRGEGRMRQQSFPN